MRICSFLPSATEILYALGLGDSLVGVTYECDFPAEARQKPIVVHSRLPATSEPAEVDRHVRDHLSRGESLYRVDRDVLRETEPELIVTQELCSVCAATPTDLGSALEGGSVRPKVLSLHPHRIEDVFQDILAVGEATGRLEAAERLVDGLKQRLEHVKRAVDGVEKRPRVVCLEWADPPFVGGHWVPEMVKLAGGLDVLGTPEKPSFRITWDQVLEGSPDVIVIMPCGYPLEQVEEEWRKSSLPEGWSELPAVREGRVYAVDANSFFSRPGPRLVTGVELLAHLFHPTLAPVVPPHRSFTRV